MKFSFFNQTAKVSKVLQRLTVLFSLMAITALQSCVFNFDSNDRYVSPLGEVEQSFKAQGFDRLDMGNAFDIRVRQGTNFSIKVRGDQTDVDDLMVRVKSSTLEIYYRNTRSRRYAMFVDIIMPTLRGVSFSGASTSTVDGFKEQDLDINLSGASRGDFQLESKYITYDLSGASILTLTGDAFQTDGIASGASTLNAFSFVTDEAYIDATGASRVRVNVLKYLKAKASGASNVRYRGSPKVDYSTSGGSVVEKD